MNRLSADVMALKSAVEHSWAHFIESVCSFIATVRACRPAGQSSSLRALRSKLVLCGVCGQISMGAEGA